MYNIIYIGEFKNLRVLDKMIYKLEEDVISENIQVSLCFDNKPFKLCSPWWKFTYCIAFLATLGRFEDVCQLMLFAKHYFPSLLKILNSHYVERGENVQYYFDKGKFRVEDSVLMFDKKISIEELIKIIIDPNIIVVNGGVSTK